MLLHALKLIFLWDTRFEILYVDFNDVFDLFQVPDNTDCYKSRKYISVFNFNYAGKGYLSCKSKFYVNFDDYNIT